MSFLQIGSWNIEHLSSRKAKDKAKKDADQSPYALADHIEMAGLDILCVQEIYDTDGDAATRQNRDLTEVCRVLRQRTGGAWQHVLTPNRPGLPATSQLCGVVFNASRVTLREVLPLEVDFKSGELNLWARWPHAMTFTMPLRRWDQVGDAWVPRDTTSSITLVNLHMKSNYDGDLIGRDTREAEAATLIAALDKVADRLDPTLILIGDTNFKRFDEPAAVTLARAGFRDMNDSDTPTYPGSRPAPFDRAYLRRDRSEFRYSRQYILQAADMERHDRFLSDHYMIKVSVKMYLDDPDAAASG